MDKIHNGFISFREFLDLILVIFRQGTVEEKLSLIFNIYDITQQKGSMSLIEFKTMIR